MKTRTAKGMDPAAMQVDADQAADASRKLGKLIERMGHVSVAGLILKQAQRELDSLVRSAAADEPTRRAFGPVRVPVAA